MSSHIQISTTEATNRDLLITADELMDGDVLLYESTGLIPSLIREFDGGSYNHAAIFHTEHVTEALAGGLTVHTVEESVRLAKRVDIYRFLRDGHRLGDTEYPVQPIDWAIESFEDDPQRYGYEQILLLAMLCSTRQITNAINNPVFARVLRHVLDTACDVVAKLIAEGREPVICSELVYRCYEQADAGEKYKLIIQGTDYARMELGLRSLEVAPATAELRTAALQFLNLYVSAARIAETVDSVSNSSKPLQAAANFVTPRDLQMSPTLQLAGTLVLAEPAHTALLKSEIPVSKPHTLHPVKEDIMEIINRGMGWLPDVPSIKDYTEETPAVSEMLNKTAMAPRIASLRAQPVGIGGGAAAVMAAPALAPAVDLRPYCSPIEDQKNLGSCTANAAVALVEYFEKRACGHHIDASRLFVYKTSRNLLGWTGDTGAYIRTTMEALVLFGTPPEDYYPYDIPKFDVEPSAFCYAFGANYHALVYYRLDPAGSTGPQVLDRVKTYLASGFPSMFGFPVYDEFMHVPPSGLVAFPSRTSKLYGGHAQVAVGYDDNLMIGSDKGALLVRNSWGTGWGLGGYAWMSYKYVTAGLAEDWWTLIRQEWVDTGKF